MRYLIANGFRDFIHYRQIVGNTATLFFSQILVLIIGLGIKTIQARVLTTYDYGLLALFGSITAFLVLFFNYASFDSLKVILANNRDKSKEREFFGIGIIIATILGLIFSLTLIFASFFIDEIFHVKISHLIIVLSPFCFILPFQCFISEITVGASKLKILAGFHLSSRVIFLTSLFAIWQFGALNVHWVILLNLLAWIVSTIVVLFRLNPSFKNLSQNYTIIRDKDKTFGLHCYFGSIVNQSTYKLDELFITYFVDVIHLGFYTLSSIICSPMTFLSRAFINSIFKRLALKDRIPIKIFVYNTIWLGFCILFLYLFSDIIVHSLFGEDYMKVSSYILPLSVAFFFQGMYAPFSFLTIKSKGKELRNVAYAEAVVSIIFNLLLIPNFHVMGAIIASILARFTHFIGLLFYYLKMTRN